MKNPFLLFLSALVCAFPLPGQTGPGFGAGEGVNGEVLCVAVQKDG